MERTVREYIRLQNEEEKGQTDIGLAQAANQQGKPRGASVSVRPPFWDNLRPPPILVEHH